MNILQSQEIAKISGGIDPVGIALNAIVGMMIRIPFKYGQNLCDYYTGWDKVTGWNGPAPLPPCSQPR